MGKKNLHHVPFHCRWDPSSADWRSSFLFMYYRSRFLSIHVLSSASTRWAGLAASLVDQSKVFPCLKKYTFLLSIHNKIGTKNNDSFFTSQMAKSPHHDVSKAIANARAWKNHCSTDLGRGLDIPFLIVIRGCWRFFDECCSIQNAQPHPFYDATWPRRRRDRYEWWGKKMK
jgi:hypothetical protein